MNELELIKHKLVNGGVGQYRISNWAIHIEEWFVKEHSNLKLIHPKWINKDGKPSAIVLSMYYAVQFEIPYLDLSYHHKMSLTGTEEKDFELMCPFKRAVHDYRFSFGSLEDAERIFHKIAKLIQHYMNELGFLPKIDTLTPFIKKITNALCEVSGAYNDPRNLHFLDFEFPKDKEMEDLFKAHILMDRGEQYAKIRKSGQRHFNNIFKKIKFTKTIHHKLMDSVQKDSFSDVFREFIGTDEPLENIVDYIKAIDVFKAKKFVSDLTTDFLLGLIWHHFDVNSIAWDGEPIGEHRLRDILRTIEQMHIGTTTRLMDNYIAIGRIHRIFKSYTRKNEPCFKATINSVYEITIHYPEWFDQKEFQKFINGVILHDRITSLIEAWKANKVMKVQEQDQNNNVVSDPINEVFASFMDDINGMPIHIKRIKRYLKGYTKLEKPLNEFVDTFDKFKNNLDMTLPLSEKEHRVKLNTLVLGMIYLGARICSPYYPSLADIKEKDGYMTNSSTKIGEIARTSKFVFNHIRELFSLVEVKNLNNVICFKYVEPTEPLFFDPFNLVREKDDGYNTDDVELLDFLTRVSWSFMVSDSMTQEVKKTTLFGFDMIQVVQPMKLVELKTEVVEIPPVETRTSDIVDKITFLPDNESLQRVDALVHGLVHGLTEEFFLPDQNQNSQKEFIGSLLYYVLAYNEFDIGSYLDQYWSIAERSMQNQELTQFEKDITKDFFVRCFGDFKEEVYQTIVEKVDVCVFHGVCNHVYEAIKLRRHLKEIRTLTKDVFIKTTKRPF